MKSLLLLFSLIGAASSAQANVSALEVSTDPERRIWGSGFSLASIEGASAQKGGGRLTTYNYASANFALQDNTHVAVRLPFTYNSAGFDDFNQNEVQEQSIDLADVIVDYTDASTLLAGDVEVFSRYRVELPTSKYSVAQKKIAGLRVDLIMSKHLIKNFQLEYWPIFTWNIQTQTVYENPDTNSFSHTKRYEFNHRLTLWYRAHQRLSMGVFAGGEDTWYNESKANSTGRSRDGRFSEHLLKLGPALRFTMNRNLNFIFNIANSVPLWGYTDNRAGQVSDLGRFRANQTEFVLLTFLNF